jgi:uncharacterized membrane protein
MTTPSAKSGRIVIFAVEGIAFLAIAFQVFYLFSNYSALPETVPIHFNGAGEADGFGSKQTLFGVLTISFILYAGLSLLQGYPQKLNFPVKMTPENAARQYALAIRMIRSLKAFIALTFAWSLYQSIQIAQGFATNLNSWFLPVFILGISAILFGYLILAFRK